MYTESMPERSLALWPSRDPLKVLPKYGDGATPARRQIIHRRYFFQPQNGAEK